MTAKILRRRKGEAANGLGPRLFAFSDLGVLLGMVMLILPAWVLPRRYFPSLCAAFSPIIGLFEGTGSESLPGRIERYLENRRPAMPVRTIAALARAGFMEEFLDILRGLRPWASAPRCTLHGGEHIAQALTSAGGAVLWVDEFHHYSLATKVALAESGFWTVHLSHPTHGFSRTRFGIAVVNPIKISVENRWLKNRVMMGFGGATGAIRALQRHLRAGDVVSVTAGGDAASPIEIPFLGGAVRLATGAPDLAYMAKVPLLPVRTIYRKDGSFEVAVEPPIEASRDGDRSAFAEAAAHEYAARLEPLVLSHPHQWRGWFRM